MGKYTLSVIDASPITVQDTGTQQLAVVYEIADAEGKVVETGNRGLPIDAAPEDVAAALEIILDAFTVNVDLAEKNAATADQAEAVNKTIAAVKGMTLDQIKVSVATEDKTTN